MLGIQYPILKGPMAYVSGPELVSAVTNAGGLGIIASIAFETTDELRDVIRKTRQLTDKPFGVNITMLPAARTINYEDYFKVSIDEGIKIIETSGRSPEPYIPMMKDAGVISMHRATRTRDIKKAESVGSDIVTILGTEAAGHPGQEEVGSFVRIPVAANAVKVPVIAAGVFPTHGAWLPLWLSVLKEYSWEHGLCAPRKRESMTTSRHGCTGSMRWTPFLSKSLSKMHHGW